MKKVLYVFALALSLGLFACSAKKAQTTTTTTTTTSTISTDMNTPPGKISFAAANSRYSAEGTFKRWNFTKVDMEKGKVESLKATAAIDLTSIWEKSPQLTDHLKAPDYFNVAKYNIANLTINNVRAKGDKYIADLELSMRDMVQKMESEFEVISKNPFMVKGVAKVNRDLFKVGAGDGVDGMIEVTYETIIQ